MKLIVQNVLNASVEINQKIVGKISHGFCVFVGFTNGDNEYIVDKMVDKLVNMRVFMDENGKTNLSLEQISGELLLISQFTLYADCKHGNRPSFIKAGKPEHAQKLYNYIIEQCKMKVPNVQTGIFGADMKVSLTNDGPFTIVLDSTEIFGI